MPVQRIARGLHRQRADPETSLERGLPEMERLDLADGHDVAAARPQPLAGQDVRVRARVTQVPVVSVRQQPGGPQRQQ